MEQEITIALAGNPNSGKTTIFNNLTGARQHVGNYPGVTVEKKTGEIKHRGYKINIVDLPGRFKFYVVYSADASMYGGTGNISDGSRYERSVVSDWIHADDCLGCIIYCISNWKAYYLFYLNKINFIQHSSTKVSIINQNFLSAELCLLPF